MSLRNFNTIFLTSTNQFNPLYNLSLYSFYSKNYSTDKRVFNGMARKIDPNYLSYPSELKYKIFFQNLMSKFNIIIADSDQYININSLMCVDNNAVLSYQNDTQCVSLKMDNNYYIVATQYEDKIFFRKLNQKPNVNTYIHIMSNDIIYINENIYQKIDRDSHLLINNFNNLTCQYFNESLNKPIKYNTSLLINLLNQQVHLYDKCIGLNFMCLFNPKIYSTYIYEYGFNIKENIITDPEFFYKPINMLYVFINDKIFQIKCMTEFKHYTNSYCCELYKLLSETYFEQENDILNYETKTKDYHLFFELLHKMNVIDYSNFYSSIINLMLDYFNINITEEDINKYSIKQKKYSNHLIDYNSTNKHNMFVKVNNKSKKIYKLTKSTGEIIKKIKKIKTLSIKKEKIILKKEETKNIIEKKEIKNIYKKEEIKNIHEKEEIKNIHEKESKNIIEKEEIKTIPEKESKNIIEKTEIKTIPEKESKNIPEKEFKNIEKEELKTIPEKESKNIIEKKLKNIGKEEIKTIPEKKLKNIPEKESKNIIEKTEIKTIPEKESKKIPEKESKNIIEKIEIKTIPEKESKKIPEKESKNIIEKKLKNIEKEEIKNIPEKEESKIFEKKELKTNKIIEKKDKNTENTFKEEIKLTNEISNKKNVKKNKKQKRKLKSKNETKIIKKGLEQLLITSELEMEKTMPEILFIYKLLKEELAKPIIENERRREIFKIMEKKHLSEEDYYIRLMLYSLKLKLENIVNEDLINNIIDYYLDSNNSIHHLITLIYEKK